VRDEIRFQSKSGLLKVRRDGDWITLDFPTDEVKKAEAPGNLLEALKVTPKEIWKGKRNYLILLYSAAEVYNASPDFVLLKTIPGHSFIITASGNDTDFISRCFVPSAGINEDPVTGGAHCTLIPYWSNVLGKKELTARQVSNRGGYLKCKLNGDRVEISGKAVTYLIGDIVISH
jgi:predicted PhzF superfamily epimerase YddE/YHI9